ncbi:Metallo-hydrolase/oxidoreductase [Calocera cornea HHB12733]|uniref:Metallo-hydrolase/oxidoreductase n=1 Tax=Calocera cornea HHB12733 TaxID=1353952 RepID=A0A165FXZ7_9BASI|nr:Metallo-hydrolase/oxidoreductase [Calocera cornea HHB12733]
MIWPLSLLPFFAPSQLPILPVSIKAGIETGVLPQQWPAYDCSADPLPAPWLVHAYNDDLTILRQSGCTDYEKPFLYLLFGSEKALLLDSGSRNGGVVPAVKDVLDAREWAGEVVVVHTHGHWDHVWGDGELKEAGYTVIPATVDANAAYFNISDYFGAVDLGDRPIDVIAIPGHEEASLAFYDHRTGILFSGDSVYPGRLYVPQPAWADFVASNTRLVEYTKGKRVTHILGAHIEQSRTPYVDYPVETVYQPEEHELELGRAALLEIQDALEGLEGPERVYMREYTIWPVERGVNVSVSDALRTPAVEEDL